MTIIVKPINTKIVFFIEIIILIKKKKSHYINSTPSSVTQKELLLSAFVLEEVQRTVKT